MATAAAEAAEAEAWAQRKRHEAVQHFLENSTFHGLWRLEASKRQQKAAWIGIVCIAACCLWLHVYQQVTEYRKFPLQSSTREILHDFHFPSVTLCEAWQLPRLRRQQLQLAADFMNFTRQLLQLPLGADALQFVPQLQSSGYSLRDLVIDCRFNSAPCPASSFTAFHHPHFGSCFTFEQQRQQRHELHEEEVPAVAGDGLSMLLYSPSSDPQFRAHPLLPDSAADTGLEIDGVRVTAHAPGTAPRISEDSVIAATSHETKIGLKEIRTTLVNTPRRPCEPGFQYRVFNRLAKWRLFNATLADRLEWRELLTEQQKCGCMGSSAVGLPLHLQKPGQRHCADVTDVGGGGFVDLRRHWQRSCGNSSRQNCLQHLLEAFPLLGRNLRQFRCHAATSTGDAADVGADMSVLHDQCASIGYQFQIFTSELPDSQSANASSGRHDARLIFQTFARKLASFIQQQQQQQQQQQPAAAVLQSLRAKGLHPGSCSRMKQRLFTNETHCSQVQDFISRHFLRLQVFPFSASVVHIAEERSYSFVDLLSHLGGILGLWVGSSIISLFELLELLAVVSGGSVAFRANSRKRRRRKIFRYPAQSVVTVCASVQHNLTSQGVVGRWQL